MPSLKPMVHRAVLFIFMGFMCGASGCVAPMPEGSAHAAERTPAKIIWRYEFSLPEKSVLSQKEHISEAAAASGATIEFKRKGAGGENFVSVIMEGQGLIADLQRIIYNPDGSITKLIMQPAQLCLKGFVSAGRNIAVYVASNFSTGYSWKIDDPAPMGLREETSGEFAQSSSLPGSPGRQGFFLHAISGGDKTITMHYRRPWEQVGEASVMLTVTVVGEIPNTLDLSEPSVDNPRMVK
ncbi:MAG: protease inhibitor I42 family protein [Deltaproteobacteria bacterium]|nr:protease inhibitor I42 family protein [Deltaproteobacteria bacterium]